MAIHPSAIRMHLLSFHACSLPCSISAEKGTALDDQRRNIRIGKETSSTNETGYCIHFSITLFERPARVKKFPGTRTDQFSRKFEVDNGGFFGYECKIFRQWATGSFRGKMPHIGHHGGASEDGGRGGSINWTKWRRLRQSEKGLVRPE
jgi:hypothetical protein